MPDDLLRRAKSRAALAGISIKEFFIEAIEQKLAGAKRKVRRPPPAIGDPVGTPVGVLTSEQVNDAMFG